MLVVKERHKKQTQMELAQAIKALNEEKERLKTLEKEKEGIIQRKREARLKMSQQVTRGESRIYDSGIHLNYLEKLQEDLTMKEKEIERQKETIEAAEEEVKKARRNFIDASKDLQAMEKHKELWLKKMLKEISMKEEKELNELGNSIHQLRKMGY